MQALAQDTVYCPGLDTDIANYVKRCAICTQHKASPPAQPMLPWDIPNSLWQEIAADYFHHSCRDYLVIASLFSKYPLLYCISTHSAQSLVQRLNDIIAQYGPSILHTDNRPPFTAEEFKRFLQRQSIDHITSSPTSIVQWFHRATGGDAKDCTQHCQGCQNITWNPPTWTAIHTNSTKHAITQGNTPQLYHPVAMQALNASGYGNGLDYLIAKKLILKKKFQQVPRCTTPVDPRPWPGSIIPLTADQQSYIPRTIIDRASTPQSYMINGQGKVVPQIQGAHSSTTTGHLQSFHSPAAGKPKTFMHPKPNPISKQKALPQPQNTVPHTPNQQNVISLFPIHSDLPGLTTNHHPASL